MIVVNVAAYSQLRHHDFVNYDDPLYVTYNAHVQAGLTWQNFLWAFKASAAANWHPVTWLSHMLDVQVFGLNAGAHHIVNLLLHIINTLLLFALLRRMTGMLGRSAFVAALFAVHPLHVESVAWIAEHKDVLSTLFWLLTMWAYVSYVRQPGLRKYLWVCLFLALGLMSKPMLVTLPFVLLLLDYWPLGRMGEQSEPQAQARGGRVSGRAQNPSLALRALTSSSSPLATRHSPLALIAEKVPLFVLAVASSIATMLAQQRGGAVTALANFPLEYRMANAALTYIEYIGKVFWPARLAVFYPYPLPLPMWWAAGSVVALVGASILIIRASRNHGYLAVGWLWYLGTLVPVLGIVQAGTQAMADRYTYVPLIGLFIMLAWGIPDLLAHWNQGRLLPASAAAIVIACAIAAAHQLRYWENSKALWQHTLDSTTDNYIAQNNLGVLLADEGKFAEAIPHYREALRLQPDFALAHYNLGYALGVQRDINGAITQMSEALRVDPNYAEAHNNLGVALANQGRMAEASTHFTAAVRIRPDYIEARTNLAAALVAQRNNAQAIDEYLQALRMQPNYALAHNGVAAVLAGEGRFAEAAQHYSEVVRLQPSSAEARYRWADALLRSGNTQAAAQQFEAALQLQPDYEEARRALQELNGKAPLTSGVAAKTSTR